MARKQKKYHYLYKTTNNLNGKYYYGMHSTHNLSDGYLGSGKRLRYSINKYGKENHSVEVLEFFENRKLLGQREKEVINLNEIAKKDCMNLVVGGTGGFISKTGVKKGAKITNFKYKEEKKSWGSIGGKNSYLKHGVNKNFLKNRCDWTNKKHSEESKIKMSESSKGMGKGCKNSQFKTCWITDGNVNMKIKKGEKILKGWKLGRILKK